MPSSLISLPVVAISDFIAAVSSAGEPATASEPATAELAADTLDDLLAVCDAGADDPLALRELAPGLNDVIEHLPSPYPTLYQLFSIGAITAKTMVVVTTPNAGSAKAKANPAALLW